MKTKDLIALMQRSFEKSGDQFSPVEQIEKIRWDLFEKTDLCDREPKGYKVQVKVRQSKQDEQPSYFGGTCWLIERDGDIYIGWETVRANTLIPDDGSKFYKWIKNKVSPRKSGEEFTMIIGNPYWDHMNLNGIATVIVHDDGDSFNLANTSWYIFCTVVNCLVHEYPNIKLDVHREYGRSVIKIYGYSIGVLIEHASGISMYKLTILLNSKH